MASLIILLALILPGIYALMRSPEKAFMDIYIPILFMTVKLFHARVLFLPDLTLSTAAIIPIFIVALVFCYAQWKFSLMDILVVAFIGIKVLSEYMNWGDKEAFNLLATQLADVWAPYSLAKLFIIPRKLLVKFSKRVVFFVFLAILISVYEFLKLGNLFILIPQKLFLPDMADQLGTLYRYGFVRIGGPFVQTIIFGMAISIALFLNYWLIHEKLYTKHFKYFPIPLRKGFFTTFTLISGLIATFSRGPLLSTIVGFILVGTGYAKNRRKSLFKRLGIMILLVILGYLVLQSYYKLNKDFAGESQSTVIYRLELLDQYWDFIEQRPFLGWGRTGLPIAGNLKSIDNEYLFSALRNGIFIPIIELIIMTYTLKRLFSRAMHDKNTQNEDSSFAFVLIGIFINLGISFATVFMGFQIEAIFFIMLGITEGYLLSSPKSFYKDQIETHKLKVQKQPSPI